MLDEFTKRSRIDSINSLNESIDQLKESHSTLVITTQAFKESIAKEKQIFERLVAIDPKTLEPMGDNTPDETPVPVITSESEHSVLSNDNPAQAQVEEDSGLDISGTLATETPKPIVSKN